MSPSISLAEVNELQDELEELRRDEREWAEDFEKAYLALAREIGALKRRLQATGRPAPSVSEPVRDEGRG